jgi:hypothetical protein
MTQICPSDACDPIPPVDRLIQPISALAAHIANGPVTGIPFNWIDKALYEIRQGRSEQAMAFIHTKEKTTPLVMQ